MRQRQGAALREQRQQALAPQGPDGRPRQFRQRSGLCALGRTACWPRWSMPGPVAATGRKRFEFGANGVVTFLNDPVFCLASSPARSLGSPVAASAITCVRTPKLAPCFAQCDNSHHHASQGRATGESNDTANKSVSCVQPCSLRNTLEEPHTPIPRLTEGCERKPTAFCTWSSRSGAGGAADAGVSGSPVDGAAIVGAAGGGAAPDENAAGDAAGDAAGVSNTGAASAETNAGGVAVTESIAHALLSCIYVFV